MPSKMENIVIRIEQNGAYKVNAMQANKEVK